MATMLAEEAATRRYNQRDLHDLRRFGERWMGLLRANGMAGLTTSEKALKEAMDVILINVIRDLLGDYHLVDLSKSGGGLDDAV